MSDLIDIVRNLNRLAMLGRTGLLDTPAEEPFDRLTRLATRLFKTPVALVSLVDRDRQLFARILSGAVAELQLLYAEPVPVGDSALDAVQREAVAKALATPDILRSRTIL